MSRTEERKTTERFIVLCGQSIEPWVANDEIFKSDRDTVIKDVAAGEYRGIAKIVAFDLTTGKCRDATKEIAREVMDRWADNDEPLTQRQKDFIADHVTARALEAAE